MFEIDLAKGTFHEVKQTREGGNMNYTKGEWKAKQDIAAQARRCADAIKQHQELHKNEQKNEWEVTNKTFGGGDAGANIVIRSPNGIIAMASTINEGLVNAEANAHLISAAPDMYEALKDLMFQFAVAVEQPHSVDTRIYNQAEQALAKAEGREG